MLTANGQTTCKSAICSVSHAACKLKIMLFHFVYFRTVTLYPVDPAHFCCQGVNMYYNCWRQEVNKNSSSSYWEYALPSLPCLLLNCCVHKCECMLESGWPTGNLGAEFPRGFFAWIFLFLLIRTDTGRVTGQHMLLRFLFIPSMVLSLKTSNSKQIKSFYFRSEGSI